MITNNMQKRSKIFETNSSSSHSAVVEGNPEFVKIEEDDLNREKITICEENYYCNAYVEDGGHNWKEVAILAYIWAKDNDEYLKMLNEVIEEYVKRPVEFKMSDDEYPPEPCNAFRKFFKDKETLKRAIFMDPGVIVFGTTNEN